MEDKMMRVIAVFWVSCLAAIAFVLPAEGQECVFCEAPKYPQQAPPLPFGAPPVVVPQVPSNAAVNRYLDAQTNATNESLSIYKYQAGILGNPKRSNKLTLIA